MPHCSGWVRRRWRASCVAGLWQYRNSALRLCIERDQLMEMLMHCHEEDMETGYTALTTVHASFTVEEIRQAQQQDDTIQQLYKALQSEQHHPHRHWKQTTLRRYVQLWPPLRRYAQLWPPLRRYAQLWPQLVTVDGIIPARAYFRNHCGPCFARNTAPAGSEYGP